MRKVFSCVFFILLFVSVRGQDGSPLLTHFRENRDIENQNWAICQDSDKVMLFANRKGIYPPLPGADKIQYLQMEVLEAKAFEERKKEFGKIFLR